MKKQNNKRLFNFSLARLEISENIEHALITIGEGNTNLLNYQFLIDLEEVINIVLENKKLRACSIIGAGKSFCLGVDLENLLSFGSAEQQNIINKARNIIRRIKNSSIPFIGLINGFCLGGGLELALSCHMRMATAKSKFGFPEITYGIFPGLNGIETSKKVLGEKLALFLILSGEMITAQKALEIGLVQKLVETKEDLLFEAFIQAQTISNTSREVIAHILSMIKHDVIDDSHYKKSDRIFISTLNKR